MAFPKNELLKPIHDYLVRACEVEAGFPKVVNITKETFWPDIASERHIDYKPDRTHITYCKPTGRQIDEYSRALELVVETLESVEDKKIVWAVANSSAFRERGPKWTKLAQDFKGMGKGYPKSPRAIKFRYEECLRTIMAHHLTKSRHPLWSRNR